MPKINLRGCTSVKEGGIFLHSLTRVDKLLGLDKLMANGNTYRIARQSIKEVCLFRCANYII